MTDSLALNNLVIWSLQIALLAGLAAALPFPLHLKAPGAKLAYLQFVLVACLLLPLLRGWKQEVISGTVAVSSAVVSVAPAHVSARHVWLPGGGSILIVLACGLAFRLCLLLAGFWRLRRLRRLRLQSRPLEPASHSAMAWSVEACLLVSDEISSPVTFGFRKPVILLPATFAALSEAMQEAILCHEVLHVRRGDWLFTVGEEFIRSVFWFHPAIWWLLGEIQLAREQAVDREVVEMTKARDPYVDALLVIAGATRLDVAPAPLFLRKRHLKQRVFSILQEVPVSRLRSVFALAAGVGLLAVSCWFLTGALPLQAAPQVVADGSGVAVDLHGAQLMHRSPVAYPREGLVKGVLGTVVVQVKLDGAGNVSDAAIVSGPEELRKAVLQSVLGWHFTSDAAGSTREISLNFALPTGVLNGALRGAEQAASADAAAGAGSRPAVAAAPRTVKSIVITGLADPQRAELLTRLPIHEGDAWAPAAMRDVVRAAKAFDEHLMVGASIDAGAITLRISTPEVRGAALGARAAPKPDESAAETQAGQVPVRVGGAVMKANVVSQAAPVYPALAKSAGVQGTVKFDATIGTDGHIKDLRRVSGPPLLVQAAMLAVKDWVYKPVLLEGGPVEVVTTIDVDFTLSQ